MANDDGRAAHRAIAIAAGVTADEMHEHAEHGLLISASGVRKMAARASDTREKMELLAQVQALRPIKGF